MSEAEREFLRHLVKTAPTRFKKIRSVVEDVVLAACFTFLSVIVGWLVVAWLLQVTIGSESGWDRAVIIWVFSLGGAGCAIHATVSSVRWLRRRPNIGPVGKDLEAKRVVDEEYEFSAAIRMQDEEHGSLIYFLHSNDGTVLVLFDRESHNLGVDDDDPLASSFVPRTRLTMVRAPESGIVIERDFSGGVLDAGDPLELMAQPEKWPENEKVCDIPWQELEARLCR